MPARLLLLSPYAPEPLYGGAVVRIHHLARVLARRHEMWWACRGPLPPHLPCAALANAPYRWAALFNPLYLWRLVKLVRSERIPTVLISSIVSGVHALALHALTHTRLIYDAHNVEHDQMRRAGSRWWYLMYLLEWLLCRRASEIWCVSRDDAELLTRRLRVPANRIRVVPNGADINALRLGSPDRNGLLRAHGLDAAHPALLFFGVLSYAPNARGVELLASEVEPRLRARGFRGDLAVAGVGSEALARRYPNLKFVGFVPAIAPLVRAVDAIVVPLESGSGTRLKIIEALACGTPVVTTSIGAEGLSRETCGSGLRVADDWEHFADEVMASLQMPRPVPLSEAFVRTHDWDQILQAVTLA
jgi:glycosyltransferase involved in cell wall biosynthesis